MVNTFLNVLISAPSFLFFHYKIDDAAHPSGLYCAEGCDDLNPFYLSCRNLAERIGTGTGIHRHRRLAVHQNSHISRRQASLRCPHKAVDVFLSPSLFIQ